MGYSWYRTDSAYHRHPKMLALKAELNQQLADALTAKARLAIAEALRAVRALRAGSVKAKQRRAA